MNIVFFEEVQKTLGKHCRSLVLGSRFYRRGIKKLEAFTAAANGTATKIIIPSEIQGLAGLAAGVIEANKE